MPSSCMTAISSGRTELGFVPALSTSKSFPASCRRSPSAMRLRAELPVQRIRTRFSIAHDVSREAVRGKNQRGEVLGLHGAKRGLRFPKWQVTPNGKLLPDLPQLFKLLGVDSWTVYRFLAQHHPESEGDTALSALQRGKVSRVLTTAENASSRFFEACHASHSETLNRATSNWRQSELEPPSSGYIRYARLTLWDWILTEPVQ